MPSTRCAGTALRERVGSPLSRVAPLRAHPRTSSSSRPDRPPGRLAREVRGVTHARPSTAPTNLSQPLTTVGTLVLCTRPPAAPTQWQEPPCSGRGHALRPRRRLGPRSRTDISEASATRAGSCTLARPEPEASAFPTPGGEAVAPLLRRRSARMGGRQADAGSNRPAGPRRPRPATTGQHPRCAHPRTTLSSPHPPRSGPRSAKAVAAARRAGGHAACSQHGCPARGNRGMYQDAPPVPNNVPGSLSVRSGQSISGVSGVSFGRLGAVQPPPVRIATCRARTPPPFAPEVGVVAKFSASWPVLGCLWRSCCFLPGARGLLSLPDGVTPICWTWQPLAGATAASYRWPDRITCRRGAGIVAAPAQMSSGRRLPP